MQRDYGLFEVIRDGCLLWRAAVAGREGAVIKLQELALISSNEFQIIHLPTNAVIARMNAKPT
jgi:hypothetical protein